VGPAGRRYRSIAAAAASECGQCHVVSVRSELNTGLIFLETTTLFGACSLNREHRMRELLRIAEENQRMLKRLQTVRPKYSHEQWEREWQANLQLIDQMSAFPPDSSKNQDQVAETILLHVHLPSC